MTSLASALYSQPLASAMFAKPLGILMPTTAIIVVVILVVLVAIVLATRKGKPELPSSEDSSARELPPTDKPSPRADIEPTRPVPLAKGGTERPSAEPKPGADADGPDASTQEAPDPAPRPSAEEAAPAAPEDAPADASETPAKPAAPAPVSKPAGGRQQASDDDRAAIKESLKGTRSGFIARLASVFRRKPDIDPALLDEMEEVLITADLGVPTTQKILGALKERLSRNELADGDAVWTALREEGAAILEGVSGGLLLPDASPAVILVVGVNGVGKTTTIGKLAARYADEGKKVLLVAGDTYRAAAVMQLEAWGRRAKCEVAKGKDRADPSAVIFDAIKRGVDEGFDLVICDTAGRLHTKTPLMEEVKKVGRSVEKALGRNADEVLLVLDATTGQNALQQANQFGEALAVSGVALTKLDGTAKGGVVLGIVDQHKIPVRFVGVGERMEDLRVFDAQSFVEALFAKPEPGDEAAEAEVSDAE
ncbi:MAG: signal recognition particle-docking protein FtsY [Polyangiales bacterium]|nr:signal recognition particle-docking protein FtsY [Sandaracinaceae bacterium]